EHPAGEVTSLDWQLKNQVPRNLPFTAVRITEGEMKSYHDFIGGCIRLECMAKKEKVKRDARLILNKCLFNTWVLGTEFSVHVSRADICCAYKISL
uniref:Uncharacterized protein n=1 Tax=Meleagris gallopavo TaxID=9103 RepID=A0A803XTR7_MELGA